MNKHNDPKTGKTEHPDQRPTELGPTSGGMGSMGSVGPRSQEPSLEEKLGVDEDDQAEKTDNAHKTTSPESLSDTTAPQAPNNAVSTAKDLDHERPGGMSGGLG